MPGHMWSEVIETTSSGTRCVMHLVIKQIRGPYKPGEVRSHVACETRQAINVFPGEIPVCVRCCEISLRMRDDNRSEVYG